MGVNIIGIKIKVLLLLVFLIGCSFISCNRTNKTIEKIKRNFEDEEYSVTVYDTISDNIKVTRVLAIKGNSYFDIFYNVAENDTSKVNDFYVSTYNNYYKLNCNSGKGVVVCCSDKSAYEISGVKIVETKPITVN